MKIKYLCYALVIAVNLQLLQAQVLPATVHKILFLGNSITYAGGYVSDVEAYFKVYYPGRQIEFINAGLPSETVSGLSEPGHAGGKFPRPDLHERLDRVLRLTKPDLVFACYGMNDGIYMPFDEERFQKFKDGIDWLHRTVESAGVKIIHVTPPVFDGLRGKNKVYATVLDRYSDWLLKQRKAAGWKVVDVHYPMKKYLEAHRKVDASFGIDGFALANDGVHPGDAGHWLMARQLLLYLDEKKAAQFSDIMGAMAQKPNGTEIFKLVAERQSLMKDAWLIAAGHNRPGMKTGLPLVEAQIQAGQIEEKIQALLNTKEKNIQE
jgi:lysophospholipase L1-like esterase